MTAMNSKRMVRRATMVGTALGCTLVVTGGIAPAASAQNVTYNGPGPYTLTRADTVVGGPRVVDVTVTSDDATVDISRVEVENSTNTLGAGIAVTNTGPGAVTVRNGSVVATGTGVTNAIDARTGTGTGAISISSTGTVSSTGNNASRGIQAASSGGNVTIVASDVAGAQRGIFVTSNGTNNTFFTTATTSITSANATATGTGQVNAIIGQGNRVIINSGTATNSNTAGNGGTAILANAGSGGVLINAGITTALGQSQAALQVFSGGAVDVTSGTTRVSQNSDGLSIQTGTEIVLRSTSVVTEGSGGARAIVLGGASGGGALNGGPNGIIFNSATLTSGSISTVGQGAFGIYATPNGSGALTIASGAITTTGAGATGIFVTPIGTGTIDGPVTINSTGALQTTGMNANGIGVAGGAGAVTVANTGQISATGNGSVGISLSGGTGARTIASDRITSGTGNGIDVSGVGAVRITSGAITRNATSGTGIIVGTGTGVASTAAVTSGTITGGANGINVTANGDVAVTSGTVALTTVATTATALDGLGINANGSGTMTVSSGSIAFTGTGNTIGINAQHTGTTGGSLSITSGDVSVIGNGGYGILGSTNSAALTINSTGAITTTGNTRQAGGQPGIANSRFANGILAYSQAGAISITNSGSVTTLGDSVGIAVEAGRAIQSFGATPTIASTAAITINNSGSVTTRGNFATGINVRGDTNPITITSNSVATSGNSAPGISTRPGGTGVTNTGFVTIDSGTINVGGNNSPGILIFNADGLNIRSGTITTAGTGASTGIQASAVAESTNAITVTSGTITTTNASGGGSGIAVSTSNAGSTSITSDVITIAGNGGGISVITPNAAQATGDITINSRDITLTQPIENTGFRTAMNVFETAGTTTINSTGAIRSTGGGILLQARTNRIAGAVNITSNVIESANSGISIAASSAVTINAASTTTSGANQAAIAVRPTAGGTVLVNAGTVTTTGANASGISVQGSAGTTAITVGTANTTGSAVDAQTVGAVTVTSGTARVTGTVAAGNFNTGIVAVATGGAATVTSSDLTVAGRGIFARGQNDASVTSGTLITTGTINALVANTATAAQGGNAAGFVRVNSGTLISEAGGINAYAPRGTTIVDSGTLTAGGSGTGIQAYGVDVTVNSGTITTGNVGIDAGRADESTTRGATIVNSGTITVNGAAAATGGAIQVNGGSVVVNSGTIVATGLGNRFGISAQIPSATVAGTSSGGTLNVTSGSIATVGDGAYGIQALTDSGAMTVRSTGTITTVGTTRFAGTQPRYSAGIIAISQSGAIAVESNAISTSGAQSDGIRVESGAGMTGTIASGPNIAPAAINVTTSGLTQTAGAGASGINIFGGGGAISVANTGTIATSGDNSLGISVSALEGATTLASNIVSTTGANASGIRVIGTTGPATLTSTRATATGLGSNAIEVNAGGAVTLDSITATAAAGGGILVQSGGLATIRATTATGGGDGASGVFVTGGTGVVLAVGSATSTGATITDGNGLITRADAIFAEAAKGAITATLGSASATGAGSDAVRLIANGTGGAVTATVNGTLTSTGGYGLFIDPPGAVVVDVANGARITGATGGLFAEGGSVAVTNLGTISSTGGAAITAVGPATISNSGTLSGTGGTAVQLGAANDIVTLRTGSVVTGQIVGGGGTDAAILIGTGTAPVATQTVAGFTGFDSLSVQSGYWTAPATTTSTVARTIIGASSALELQNGAAGIAGYATGTIANAGTLVVRSTATSAGNSFGATTVTGTGGVTFTGGGLVTLAGANTLANTGTNIIDSGRVLVTGTQGGNFATGTGGTLQVGTGGTTGSFTGNLANNGTLIINRSDEVNFAGALTGTGLFVKQGAGRVVFGANYAFTGTTQLNGGAIRFTTPVSATTELDLQGAGQADFSGLSQTIAELKSDSAATSVNIAGGALTVNQGTSTTFAGAIVGAGTLTKTGTGTLNLTGASTYAGPTTVNGGRLAVNGSIVSPVTVNTGGTLGGTGSVGTTTIASGGIWAPGNSIGTQSVNGNLTFAAGSIYQVEVNAAGAADRVNATGTATLSGGTVQVLAEAGNYARQTGYTILTAAGGVTGRFAGVTSNFAFLSPFLAYGPNAVTLTLARNDLAFGAVATTGNQLSVANAVFARGPNDALFNTVLFQSVGAAQASFGTLSGELNAGLATELTDNGRRVRQAVIDRGFTPGEGLGLWATVLQSTGQSDANANRARLKANRTGVVGGLDYTMGAIRFGAFGGYQDDDLRIRAQGATAAVETVFAGASVAYRSDALSIQAGAHYAWHDIRTQRSLAAAGLGTATGSVDANSAQLWAEAGYALTQGSVVVTPFIAHAYSWTRVEAFTEAGGTGTLTVARDRRDTGLASAGIRLTGEAPIGAATFLPRLSIAYQRGYGDLDGVAVQRFAGTGPAFAVSGASLGKDGLAVDGGFDVSVDRFSFGVGGFATTTNRWSDYGGRATISLRF